MWGTSIQTLKKNYRSKALKDQLWTYDKASYIPSFEKTIDDLKVMSTGAYQYMKNINPNIGIDVTSKLNSYVTCFWTIYVIVLTIKYLLASS